MRALRLPGCRVDLTTRDVHRDDGQHARLTIMEARLLERLASTPGEAVSRDTLLVEVWDYRPGLSSRAPDVAIRRLRTKLEPDPASPRLVHTVHGAGWRLDAVQTELPTAPVPTTTLLGRDALVTTLQGQLDVGVLAVTGPPGIGKTALIEATLGGRPHLRVPLDGVTDLDDLLHAMARALHVPLADGPLARLGRALRARPGLVWLDPVERLAGPLEAALGAWRTASPQTRWVLGSRDRLAFADASVVVPPLDRASARALFETRARATGWQSAAPDRVEAFVDSLDGLPLAIELAAARVRTVGIAGLTDATGVRHDRLDRGDALLGALEDAWARLDDDARHVLARCALLEGRFDLAAADALTDTTAWVGDALEALETHSLLTVVQTPEGPRYDILGVVRWFARRFADGGLDRLRAWALATDDHASLRAAQRRHPRDAALALHVDDHLGATLTLDARRAMLEATEPDTPSVARRVQLALARLDWQASDPSAGVRLEALRAEATEAGDAELFAEIGVDLARHRRGRHGVADDDDLLEAALTSRSPAIRARALRERARQHAEAGRFSEARLTVERALAADRRAGGRLRDSLETDLGRLAIDSGRAADGLAPVRGVLDRQPRDPRVRQAAWSTLAALLLQTGGLDEAVGAFERALELQDQMGLATETAVTLGNLAILYAEQGDPTEARYTLLRALAMHEELGRARSAATTRANLGVNWLLEGRPERARTTLTQARDAGIAGGWANVAVASTYGLAVAHVHLGEVDAARAMFRDAHARGTAIDFPQAAMASSYLHWLDDPVGEPHAGLLAALRGEGTLDEVEGRIAALSRRALS